MAVRTRSLGVALAVASMISLAGCPPQVNATRDGGTACSSHTECNPSGTSCGVVHLCVQGFCSDTTSVLACRDGGYPEGGISGMCLSYVDCNPPPACGLVVTCIQYMCDPTAPRIMIPCPDAGMDGGPDGEVGVDAGAVQDGSDAASMDAAGGG